MKQTAARLARLTQWAGPYATLVQMVLAGLVILSVSRLGLVAWQWERVSATGILGEIMVQGVRADLIMLGYLIVLPLVLSPLLSPEWNRGNGRTARLLDRLVGRLSGWQVQTSYGQMASALQGADRLLALGEAEAAALQSAFGIERARIDICPNGIAPRFFDADPGLFRQAYGIDVPFVLMTGAISPYKNQLGVVRALAGSGLRCVLIGRAERAHAAYLELLQREPGVRWLGPLDHGDPLLASAYAAAAVLALLSQGEVQPLSVLEALAAGTPAVMTSRSALVVPGSGAALRTVDWQDGPGIRQAIEALLRTPPPRAQVAQLVAEWRWEQVAQRIAANYRQALAQRR